MGRLEDPRVEPRQVAVNNTANSDPLASNPFLVNLAKSFNVTSIPLAIFILICILIAIILFITFLILAVRSCLRRKYSPKRQRRRFKGIYLDEIPGVGDNVNKENCGSMEYSLEYDLLKKQLRVGILQASDLLAPDADSYVKVHMFQAKNGNLTAIGKAHKTKSIMKDSNPCWQETFGFHLDESMLNQCVLTMEVFQYHSSGQDSSLGILKVPLETVEQAAYMGRTVERFGWLEPSNFLGHNGAGEMCVILQHSPQDCYVKVTVLEIKQLNLEGIVKPDRKLEILLSVQMKQAGKKIKSHDSPTRTELINPYFDYRCGFSIADSKLDDTTIECKLKYRGLFGIKYTIAKIDIGRASQSVTGSKQWIEMLQNPRRAVAMWHLLEYKVNK